MPELGWPLAAWFHRSTSQAESQAPGASAGRPVQRPWRRPYIMSVGWRSTLAGSTGTAPLGQGCWAGVDDDDRGRPPALVYQALEALPFGVAMPAAWLATIVAWRARFSAVHHGDAPGLASRSVARRAVADGAAARADQAAGNRSLASATPALRLCRPPGSRPSVLFGVDLASCWRRPGAGCVGVSCNKAGRRRQ